MKWGYSEQMIACISLLLQLINTTSKKINRKKSIKKLLGISGFLFC